MEIKNQSEERNLKEVKETSQSKFTNMKIFLGNIKRKKFKMKISNLNKVRVATDLSEDYSVANIPRGTSLLGVKLV